MSENLELGRIARWGRRLTGFAVDHPRLVTWSLTGSTLLVAALALLPTFAPDSFPMLTPLTVDTDPENMLPYEEPARETHRRVKAQYGLSDGIVVGIVNESEPHGAFNPGTLGRLHALTEHVMGLAGVVKPDVLSLATIDDMVNTSPGELRFDWLMRSPPADQDGADLVRERALRLPHVRDTLVSADAKTVVLFVPLVDKKAAHDVYESLVAKVGEIGAGGDAIYYAGLPVAEETFGVEMFEQMAISAPIAMALIFVLLWIFFKSLVVILAPMIIAMMAALGTMGLLVVTGNTVHIMSSMIPIFIMPIAVLDAIHIISDFFEKARKGRDRRTVIMEVMEELSLPMLFTSLTTAAGFASLALTPIPPVQVFGIFVACGVMLAWFWTVTFIPSYLASISDKRLASFGRPPAEEDHETGIFRTLDNLTFRRAKLVLLGAALLVGGAVYGITRIEINDNPVRWFESDHPLRQADVVLNEHFGGTHEVYLELAATEQAYRPNAYATQLSAWIDAEAAATAKVLAGFAKQAANAEGSAPADVLDTLDAAAREARKLAAPEDIAGWSAALDLIDQRYETIDDAGDDAAAYRQALAAAVDTFAAQVAAGYARLKSDVAETAQAAPGDREAFRAALPQEAKTPADKAAARFVAAAAQRGERFKDPQVLRYLEELEAGLAKMTGVGKTTSLATIVKTVHRDLVSGAAPDYRIPNQRASVAQVLEQLTSSHRKDDLWHFVTPSYDGSLVWLQLTSADNQVMEALSSELAAWRAQHPPPPGIEGPSFSGLTYINMVWQQKMVTGMTDAFLGSFLIVLAMMVLLFRSLLWGILSMLPLSVTVAICYGAIGLIGKDYDMPVAVLSSLSLGLAIDYAIHFIARARDLRERHGTWEAARHAVFAEPARAIGKNAIVVGLGFTPLLLAPLLPYKTVGMLIAALLLLAGAATLVILPSIIAVGRRWLFKHEPPAPAATIVAASPERSPAP